MNVSTLHSVIIGITMFDVLPSSKLGKHIFHFDELDEEEAFSNVFREADIF